MANRHCTNCGQQLTEDSRFCPNCGGAVHETAQVPTPEADVNVPPPPAQSAGAGAPQAAPPQQRTQGEREARNEVLAAGGVIAAFIAAPTPSAFLSKLEGGIPSLGAEEALGLFGFYLANFPLTSAAIIWFYLLLDGQLDNNPWLALYSALAGLLLMPLLGNFLGLNVMAGLSFEDLVYGASGGHPFLMLVRVLVQYFTVYFETVGLWAFIASLAVGFFVPWMWKSWLFPYYLQ